MKHSSSILLVLVVVALAFAGFVGCSKEESPASPSSGQQELVMSVSNPLFQVAMATQNKHTKKLMEDTEVVGTATGIAPDGKPAVLVLLKSDARINSLPKSLDGVPVVPWVTGEIKALKTTITPHTARMPRPIELGVSGGNALDLANGYCCGGTLGALVTKNGIQYILSNSHVFAGDTDNNSNDPDVSEIGNPIDQPGLIDVSCQNIPNDYVANLSSLSTLINPAANVDCAIAQVIPGMVRTDGSIYEIGVISSTILLPSLNLAVKKSGRTTGLTRSYINAINMTVTVGYESECNGDAYTKTFTGQVGVYQKRSAFLNSGDSGSLMVEDVAVNPRPVGLLFAGSTTSAIANPIGAVCSWLGVTMVGI
ncbi:MAG: hypothetical protein WC674_00600 [Candidatus Krumholzibacteriia bacterium]